VAEWQRNDTRPLSLFIDVERFALRQKSFPAAKQGAFNQALGRQSRCIFDATGGWGSDALLMCSQGYQVTIIERNPVMALLLKDAMQRLASTDWAKTNSVSIPVVIEGDAINLLSDTKLAADCVYLDPMFPPKRKKSAAPNKNIQFLKWLVGQDSDADELLKASLQAAYPRIVVKRPDFAPPLLPDKVNPAIRFSSKLVHYDVYTNR